MAEFRERLVKIIGHCDQSFSTSELWPRIFLVDGDQPYGTMALVNENDLLTIYCGVDEFAETSCGIFNSNLLHICILATGCIVRNDAHPAIASIASARLMAWVAFRPDMKSVATV